jgi:ArsR family transcriptional regulator
MDAEAFARAHRVLAEPKRVEILEAIRRLDTGDGVTCTSVLAEMSVSQSTFSHHISELTDAELITGKKEGRFYKLSVHEEAVRAYIGELQKI